MKYPTHDEAPPPITLKRTAPAGNRGLTRSSDLDREKGWLPW